MYDIVYKTVNYTILPVEILGTVVIVWLQYTFKNNTKPVFLSWCSFLPTLIVSNHLAHKRKNLMYLTSNAAPFAALVTSMGLS